MKCNKWGEWVMAACTVLLKGQKLHRALLLQRTEKQKPQSTVTIAGFFLWLIYDGELKVNSKTQCEFKTTTYKHLLGQCNSHNLVQ